MIKYVELTPPEASAFRQAKILSIECGEGDRIKEGDTLFLVQSGNAKLKLPATRSGRIIELIVNERENITLSTALLLLETEVPNSTATPPINTDSASAANSDVSNNSNSTANQAGSDAPTAPKVAENTHQQHGSTRPQAVRQEPKMPQQKKSKKRTKHEQQTLNLSDEPNQSPTARKPNFNREEVVLDQVVRRPTASDIETINNTSKQVRSAVKKPKENIVEPQQAPKSSTLARPSATSLTGTPMSETNIVQINVPDIGADSAKVIEILVSIGDEVAAEDPLVTLESDKASMDVPSTHNGIVTSISVLMDQDVSEGTPIIELEVSETDAAATPTPAEPKQRPAPTTEPHSADASSSQSTANKVVDVTIPDIGGDSAKVVEILVEVGQAVEIEDPLATLESDKASMDVPSSVAGTIQSIEIAVDQDVGEGTVVVKVLAAVQTNEPAQAPAPEKPTAPLPTKQATAKPQVSQQKAPNSPSGSSHASPSIRRFARELGVDLSSVAGTGRKSRITRDDIKVFVKTALQQPTADAVTSSGSTRGAGIPPIPAQDFSRFGETEVQDLNKIKRLTAENLHRSWLNVPHVTHNDESNISDLEQFRKQLNSEYKAQKRDIKLSPLAFIVKAVVNALQAYPQFNSSLDPSGEQLILKKYFNIGIAVETPNGLVVPVVRNADTKSVAAIAQEMGELASKARNKKLTMNDMSGACITISSLGGIGGTSFTPIVNAPEVAILGVSRNKIQPVWNGTEFVPGTMLPLSLSYDHRVIDGAEAARFTRHIAAVLEDVRRLTV